MTPEQAQPEGLTEDKVRQAVETLRGAAVFWDAELAEAVSVLADALAERDAEAVRLQQERDGWKRTARHYESIAANAGLL